MAAAIYENDKERMQHLGTIHEIAHMCGKSESEVEKVYDRELSKLKQVARVKDFLPVLIRRVVLDNLREAPRVKSRI